MGHGTRESVFQLEKLDQVNGLPFADIDRPGDAASPEGCRFLE
jgi:hypothetical protein